MVPSSLPKLNLDALSKILLEADDILHLAPVSKEWLQAAELAFTQLYILYSASQHPGLQKRIIQTEQDPTNTLKIKHLYETILQEAKESEEGEKLLQSFPPDRLLNCAQLEQLSDQIEATWAHNLCTLFSSLSLDDQFFEDLQGSEIEKGYKIKDWMETHPDELANIEICRLAGYELTSIPKEIGMFKNLKGLILSDNQIRKIPKEIFELENLETLSIDGNQISDLPKEIGKLKKLTELYLSKNHIQKIPTEIGELKNLEGLYFAANKIQEIPKEVGNLIMLKYLNLSDNAIQEIPEEIGELTNLEGLYLDRNKIQEIPQKILELPKIKSIKIDRNQTA